MKSALCTAMSIVVAAFVAAALFVYGGQRPWVALPAGTVSLVVFELIRRR